MIILSQQLLVRDPRHRLSGDTARSHPFFEPLKDIWAEIEDLKHPPCPKPSVPVLCGGDATEYISFDLQEDSSKFDAQCTTQISYSRRVVLPETPQTPFNEEYFTPREVFLTPEQNSSLESPPFLTRRREALEVKRPGRQTLRNDNRAIDGLGPEESGLSVILQKEAFMSYYIETSFQTNGSIISVGNHHPLPSTDSAGRFFSDEPPPHLYGTCTMQRRLNVDAPEESFDEDKVRAETSFTDSGLDFPLGSSPESWGHRKSDSFKKPLALQQPKLFQQRLVSAKDSIRVQGGRRILDDELEILPAKPKEKAAANFSKADLKDHSSFQWTFDEKITISLLEARFKLGQQERLGCLPVEPIITTTVSSTSRSRGLSKPQLVNLKAVSERIMKAAGRRIADALRRRRT